MVDLSRRLQLLLAGLSERRGAGGPTSGGEAGRVLVATLDYAEPGERDALALATIATGREEALLAVLRRLDLYGQAVVDTLAAAASLEPAVEAIIDEGQPQSTHHAIEVIEKSGRADLLHLLLRLLDSPRRGISEQAGRAFLSVVIRHVGESGRRNVAADDARKLDYAIADALETYPEHRNRSCLLAAAIAAARPGPRLATMLDDREAPAALSLRSAVRDIDDPVVRRNLLNWLGVERLARPAQHWMHRLHTAEQFADFLAHGHLLREPGRRRSLRRVDRPKQCAPPAAIAAQMDRASQRWLPDLVASLGLPTAHRIEHLRDAIALPNPLARLRAANDLATLALSDEAAKSALELYCFDRDAAVASSAAMNLLAPQQRTDDEFLARLIDTKRPEIADPARWRIVSRNVAAFFEHWLDLHDHHRLAAAHRLIERDRDPFIQHLRDRIALSPREERLAAIAIARRLRIIDDVADAILVQTASADPRIASAAVACLSQAQHPRRGEAARTALRHAHPRVRANAVETIAAFDEPPLISIIAPMMAARENRVRANAIRAVLKRKPDRAEPNLRLMLRDANPLHRVSALWVAKRGRVSSVLDELAAMATTDPLEPVRERAVVAKRALLLNENIGRSNHPNPHKGVRHLFLEEARC